MMNQNPVVALFKRLWRFSPDKRVVVGYIILFLCANIVNFFQPLVVGYILNTIQEQGITSQNIGSLILLISLFIVLSATFWLFHGPARVLENKNAFLVRAKYKEYLMHGVLRLPSSWHANHHSGDTIDKVEKGTTALFEFSSRTFEVIETLVRFTSSFIALMYFNLHAGYIVAFVVVSTLYMILRFDRVLAGQYRELNAAENTIAAKIFDSISNITTIIILRVEELVEKNIVKKIMKPFRLYSRNKVINEAKWFLVSLMSSFMMFFVLLTYLFANVSKGTAAIGTIFVLYEYVNRINGLFFRFAYRYGDIVRHHASVLNAEELENAFVPDRETHVMKRHNWNRLAINNLTFSYDSDATHLKDISLVINRGERIALIGESGSGKTTFLKVLRELYNPDSVTILLDDKQITFSDMSDDVALVPQDPELFATTIKENITMGVPYKQATIEYYARLARVFSVIERLPQRYDSFIYEKGVNLSGGEKQRLALARGLIAARDKEILLLDEPTSSVDPQNERAIYENIFSEFKGKTILSTIHRLHLLDQFDKVLLFDKGKLLASGTFTELQQHPRFIEMWEKYISSSEE